MTKENIIRTITDNMALLCKRRNICADQRRLTLAQFIEFSAQDSSMESIFDTSRIYNDAKALDGELNCEEKVFLCKTIARSSGFQTALSNMLLDTSDDVPEDARGRIAFVKNNQNEDAFLGFASSIKNARAFYAPAFSDCCEAVLDGKCEYCLLPIENADGDKLYSFYSLIYKHELKICLAARYGSDDTQSTTYALVAKNIPKSVIKSPYLRFEFIVLRDKSEHVDDIISALRYCDCELNSLGSQPVEYDNQKQKCFFSIEASSDNLVALLIYIENEYPRYTPMGIYKIDKEN